MLRVLDLLRQGYTGQTFTHCDDDAETPVQATFAVDLLRQRCEANFVEKETPEGAVNDLDLEGQVVRLVVPVEAHHAQFCVDKRGVEAHRLARLLVAPKTVWATPLIFIKLPDSQLLLVDGTHRYVMLYQARLEWCRAFIVPYEIGQEFIIEDFPKRDPDELMGSFSGIV